MAIIALAWLGALGPGAALAGRPLLDDASKKNHNWLAICPRAWEDSVNVLVAFRGDRYRAGVWTLEDIDSTYGGHTPELIQQALHDAYSTWTVRPRWVLLVGDHFITGGVDDIISDWRQYNPELGYIEDYTRGLWPYMDLNADNVPELCVGRLPALSAEDVGNYVAKVKAHDMGTTFGSGSLALIQDTDASGNDPAWVRELADSLYATWVPDGPKRSVHMSALPCCYSEWEAAALSGWNSSPSFVIAMGTGSGWWELVHFFDVCASPSPWDVNKLGAGTAFPALLGLSCAITGTDQWWTCGHRPPAEQLLMSRRDRGAVVVIGPTRNTKQLPNFLVGKHLLQRRLQQDQTWGEAFLNGMKELLSEDPSQADHVFEYVLEGDPAADAKPWAVTASAITPPLLSFRVGAPYPNPSVNEARIQYVVPGPAHVRVEVFDVSGRSVRTLADRSEPPGSYVLEWDHRNRNGVAVASGVYFILVDVGGRVASRKVAILR